MFGSGIELINDGPDPARLATANDDLRAQAQQMLRRGLAACESSAVAVIERAGLRALVPDLESVAGANDSLFRAHVIVALRILGSEIDHSDRLLWALNDRSEDVRITGAIGARHFQFARMRGPLLDLVRRDGSYLVRSHAAESLLALADIYPREVARHTAIFAGIVEAQPPQHRLLDAPKDEPDPANLKRFSGAADLLERLLKDRAAAGPCSLPIRPDRINGYMVRLGDQLIAVTAEETISSCERELSFVVFVESPDGFSKWLSAGTMMTMPGTLRMGIETRSSNIPVEYRRQARALTVGTLAIDLSKGNVAVVSLSSHGVAVRDEQAVPLVFHRDRARSTSDAYDFYAEHTEVAAEITELLRRSSGLRGLVALPVP